jgi:hypothetical protein
MLPPSKATSVSAGSVLEHRLGAFLFLGGFLLFARPSALLPVLLRDFLEPLNAKALKPSGIAALPHPDITSEIWLRFIVYLT